MNVQTNPRNWKEQITDNMERYNREVSEITTTLTRLVRELNDPPHNHRTKVESVKGDSLTWYVSIRDEKKAFRVDDFKIGTTMSEGDIGSLEERIQTALVEKFTFELK